MLRLNQARRSAERVVAACCRGACAGLTGGHPLVEALEPRRLLTAAMTPQEMAERGLSLMDWQGQEITVKTDEWLVRLKPSDGNGPGDAASIIEGSVCGARTEKVLAQDLALVRLRPGMGYDSLALRWMRGVFGSAEPNQVGFFDATLPNDAGFAEQWALNNTGQEIQGTYGTAGADIDAPEAWDTTTGLSDIVVAVIDTGVDYNHEDLADRIDSEHWHDFGGQGDDDPMDDGWHGTHVAGIIGAHGDNKIGVTGVNWDVTLLPLKISDSGYITVDAAFAALNYCVALRQDGVNIRVANMSWGFPAFSKELYAAVEACGEAGILCVAAAGNFDINIDENPRYPAAFDLPNVITVAATDNNDGLWSLSDVGPTSVHLGAPG